MQSKLNVIALISGGKDSFFSILHCVANGHTVVALANLFPPARHPTEHTSEEHPDGSPDTDTNGEDEEDLNSYMYQTVGHGVIPLYAEALGLPLYRQEITGTAVNTDKTYAPSPYAEETTMKQRHSSLSSGMSWPHTPQPTR